MAAPAMIRANRSELESIETRDTLFLLGGLALVLFGAGLVITNPAVKKLLGGANLGGLIQHAIPDFERYMKLRSM
jgi:hypothetical protein